MRFFVVIMVNCIVLIKHYAYFVHILQYHWHSYRLYINVFIFTLWWNDIELVQQTLSQFSTELYVRNCIFDYATEFYWKNQSISEPRQIKIDDQLFSDFLGYLKKRNFSYKTLSEQSLEELTANAKREKYYDLQKDIFTELESRLSHKLEMDLSLNREELTELLDQEITSRYFYEEGAIASSLKYDDVIKKAVEVLNNKTMYNSILKVSPN